MENYLFTINIQTLVLKMNETVNIKALKNEIETSLILLNFFILKIVFMI